MRLEEPFFVEQAGEAVEQSNVLRCDASLRVDALPIVEDAVGIVNRRVAPQSLRDRQPARRDEVGHAPRTGAITLCWCVAVYVTLAEVAVQGMYSLEDLRVRVRVRVKGER